MQLPAEQIRWLAQEQARLLRDKLSRILIDAATPQDLGASLQAIERRVARGDALRAATDRDSRALRRRFYALAFLEGWDNAKYLDTLYPQSRPAALPWEVVAQIKELRF